MEVMVAVSGLAAVAVSTQIGDYQRVALCEVGRDPAPLHMRLRIAVQKQDRRPVAADNHVDGRTACLDRLTPKAGKKVHRARRCGLSQRRRTLHGHSSHNYAQAALEKRTPRTGASARNPVSQSVWGEYCHGDPPSCRPDVVPPDRARAVERLRVRFAKLHTAGMLEWDDLSKTLMETTSQKSALPVEVVLCAIE